MVALIVYVLMAFASGVIIGYVAVKTRQPCPAVNMLAGLIAAQYDAGDVPVSELPRQVYQCQGVEGCDRRPVTVRRFNDGETQRLCAVCAHKPDLVPPSKRPPGTPGADPP